MGREGRGWEDSREEVSRGVAGGHRGLRGRQGLAGRAFEGSGSDHSSHQGPLLGGPPRFQESGQVQAGQEVRRAPCCSRGKQGLPTRTAAVTATGPWLPPQIRQGRPSLSTSVLAGEKGPLSPFGSCRRPTEMAVPPPLASEAT